MAKRYLHTPEDCGTHDVELDGECIGCGKSAIDVVSDQIKEAADNARLVERAKIVAWLRHSDRDQVFGPGYAWNIERGEHVSIVNAL